MRTGAPARTAAAAAAMAQQQMTSSQKALMLELKSLQEEPVEGFRITLVDESDLYNWEVAIFGPPNTLYEGGYFKVLLSPDLSVRAPGPRLPRRSWLVFGARRVSAAEGGGSSPRRRPPPSAEARRPCSPGAFSLSCGLGAGGRTTPGEREASFGLGSWLPEEEEEEKARSLFASQPRG